MGHPINSIASAALAQDLLKDQLRLQQSVGLNSAGGNQRAHRASSADSAWMQALALANQQTEQSVQQLTVDSQEDAFSENIPFPASQSHATSASQQTHIDNELVVDAAIGSRDVSSEQAVSLEDDESMPVESSALMNPLQMTEMPLVAQPTSITQVGFIAQPGTMEAQELTGAATSVEGVRASGSAAPSAILMSSQPLLDEFSITDSDAIELEVVSTPAMLPMETSAIQAQNFETPIAQTRTVNAINRAELVTELIKIVQLTPDKTDVHVFDVQENLVGVHSVQISKTTQGFNVTVAMESRPVQESSSQNLDQAAVQGLQSQLKEQLQLAGLNVDQVSLAFQHSPVPLTTQAPDGKLATLFGNQSASNLERGIAASESTDSATQ